MLYLSVPITYACVEGGAQLWITKDKQISATCAALTAIDAIIQISAHHFFSEYFPPERSMDDEISLCSKAIILLAAKNVGNDYVFYNSCATMVNKIIQIAITNLFEKCDEYFPEFNEPLNYLPNVARDTLSGFLNGVVMDLIANNGRLMWHRGTYNGLTAGFTRCVHVIYTELTSLINLELLKDGGNYNMQRVATILTQFVPELLASIFLGAHARFEALAETTIHTYLYDEDSQENYGKPISVSSSRVPFNFYNDFCK